MGVAPGTLVEAADASGDEGSPTGGVCVSLSELSG
jgi:hypothetical protein